MHVLGPGAAIPTSHLATQAAWLAQQQQVMQQHMQLQAAVQQQVLASFRQERRLEQQQQVTNLQLQPQLHAHPAQPCCFVMP